MFNQMKSDYSTKQLDRHNTFSSYYYRLIEKGLANLLGLLSKLLKKKKGSTYGKQSDGYFCLIERQHVHFFWPFMIHNLM